MSALRFKPLHWVLLAAIVAVVAMFCLRRPDGEPEAASTVPKADAEGRVSLSATQREALGIRTVDAEPAAYVPVTGLPAEAMPPLAASTQVTVPFAGVVTRVLVDEGESVRRGQPLLRVQSRDLIAVQGDLARARAEAGVAAQQARRDALLEREGLIPAARRAESAARASAAGASVAEANAQLSQLRRAPGGQPGEYDILAPQAGVLLRRQAMPGQAMAAMAPAFVIADSRELDIQFNAPVTLRTQLRPGLSVALPDGSRGEVLAIGADTDTASQMLRLRARAEAPDALIAGQQFELTLLLPAPPESVSVPASALLPHGDRDVLYVEDAEGRFRGQVVERLGGEGDAVVVRGAALGAGTRVVTKGVSVLKSLAPVAE